jgi:hypothetical protein
VAQPWEADHVVLGGLVAVVAALNGMIAIRGGVVSSRPARFKRQLGGALLAWGVGRLLKCLLIAAGADRPLPALGNLLVLGAVPLAVAGMPAVPRFVAGSRPVARIVLDAGLLSTATSLLAWRLLFVSDFASTPDLSRVLTALTLLLEIALCSAILVTALRELQPCLTGVAVGVICFLLGDVMLLGGNAMAIVPSTWVGQLLWTVTWPLAVWGAVRCHPSRRPTDDPTSIAGDPDARVTGITTIVALLLLLAGIGVMIGQTGGEGGGPAVDPVSWAIVLTAVGLLGSVSES